MTTISASADLRESTALLGRYRTLRERMANDGYLFFRRLLDPRGVSATGRGLLGGLQDAGWMSADADPRSAEPLRPVRAVSMREAATDAGYRSILSDPGFNSMPFVSPLAGLMGQLLGPAGFCYPLKFPRVVYPAALVPHQPGNIIHKDYRSVQDMFTTWVPLGAVPRSLGGLAVRPGSQHTTRVRHRPLERLEPGWLTIDYEPGDVIVFHCLTTHAALPNLERRMRVSAEYRWQLADQPAPRRMVLGPGGRELGSRLFSRTDWWRSVPQGLTLFDDDRDPSRSRLPAPPSRFVSFTN